MTTSTSATDRAGGEPRARARAGGSSLSGLSLVAETGDGCRIYRHTNGLYAVCGPGSLAPARSVATLACAYAACQDITRMTG